MIIISPWPMAQWRVCRRNKNVLLCHSTSVTPQRYCQWVWSFFFFLFLTMSCLCERCACARAHFYGYELRCVVFTWDQIRMHINSGNMSKYRTAEDLLSHSEWCGGYWRREWDPTTSRKKNSTLIHAIVWNYISIGWTENIGMTCQFGERNTHTTRARFS